MFDIHVRFARFYFAVRQRLIKDDRDNDSDDFDDRGVDKDDGSCLGDVS